MRTKMRILARPMVLLARKAFAPFAGNATRVAAAVKRLGVCFGAYLWTAQITGTVAQFSAPGKPGLEQSRIAELAARGSVVADMTDVETKAAEMGMNG